MCIYASRKKLCFFTFLILLMLFVAGVNPALAGHIAGGEVYYTQISINNATVTYQVTLRLFRECNPPPSGVPGQGVAELPFSVQLGIFEMTSPVNTVRTDLLVNRTSFSVLQLGTGNPCIINAPQVCYQVGEYSTSITLPISAAGYQISYQTCCRTNGIANIDGQSVGATYAGFISPSLSGGVPQSNNSAIFSLKDTALICQDKSFTLDFSATDPDGDSLVYSFCDAYNGGAAVNSSNIPPSPPPYGSIPYAIGATGSQPLGTGVSINSRSGIISGISPAAGSYVVTVCITEYRNGRIAGFHRKDFTLKIAACDFAEANLNPNSRTFCGSATYQFENGSTSSSITGYLWDFGVPGTTTDSSTRPTPSFTYPDTGRYKVILTVYGPNGCNDKDSLDLGIYPGFKAKFKAEGPCVQSPYVFTDQSVSPFGSITYWKWNFGDPSVTSDTARTSVAQYRYSNTGAYTVLLTTRNSNGCEDTAQLLLDVAAGPALSLAFRDTLICNRDTLQLSASGNGSFSWTPALRIINRNTATPLVYPNDTTRYIVTLTNNGCVSRDSVQVNVLDRITVELPPVLGICAGDSILIPTKSDGLIYSWTPATRLSSPTEKQPLAFPSVTTFYQVSAALGGYCSAQGNITVNVAPYPFANLRGDSVLCFGKTGRLLGTIRGSSFRWLPETFLSNPRILNPVVTATQTTRYILEVTDTIGCPKPSYDTLLVKVIPQVKAFAGNDTVAIGNQPIQLQATGGTNYEWEPAWPLNRRDTSAPVATISNQIDSVLFRVKVSTPEGCFAYDEVLVKIFQTGATIFVPTAFTPNADGRNDLLRAIPVGFQANVEFRVYNRLGQEVFFTNQNGKGWNGIYKGQPQPAGTYVYFARGLDYTGKPIIVKGTSVLIR